MPSPDDGAITIAAAGDAIVTQRLACYADDGLEPIVRRVRDADASFVNLETIVHDYEGYPRAQHGDKYMRAPPWVLDELSWAGFDLFAAANNHVDDYSHGGMEATMRELEARELPYAGLGRTLDAAREPAYLETGAGRVGLVAACSTFPPGAAAGRQRPDVQGRPGLSPLGLSTRYRVPAEEIESLRRLSDRLGFEEIKERRNALGFPAPWGGFDESEAFTLLNVGGDVNPEFEAADEYGVRIEADEDDVDAITRRIDAAARQADWVIASLHAHEGRAGRDTDRTIPAFLERFARACIDAGADAFVGHGPHTLRGIELYGGAPIFYSLGNVLFQSETISRYPAEAYERNDLGPGNAAPDVVDAGQVDDDGRPIGFMKERHFYESVLPVCQFDDGDVERIELHPIELGFDRDRPHRGRPRLASGAEAERIIGRLSELSEPYDTTIDVRGDVGVVTR